MIELAPSILSADFANLARDARAVVEGGATLLHVDVMDGHFVPNITIGPPVVKSLRQAMQSWPAELRVPLDCHLMIENADDYISTFAEAGADWISVHQEACVHLHRTIQHIRAHKCRTGVVINPATPVHTLDDILSEVDLVLVMSVNPGFGGQQFIPHSLEKIRQLVRERERRRLNFRIEVDGGVALDTVAEVVRAGAELLVAGSAVFGHGEPTQHARNLLKAARESALQKV